MRREERKGESSVEWVVERGVRVSIRRRYSVDVSISRQRDSPSAYGGEKDNNEGELTLCI